MTASNPLKVSVDNGELVIRIGINTLAQAIAAGSDFHKFDDRRDEYVRNFAIIDADKFARDIAAALQHEKEDGSTPISDLLDEMGRFAIEDGSLNIEYNHKIKFGEKAQIEKW